MGGRAGIPRQPVNGGPFISDSSPLIALAQIDRLALVRQLYAEIIIPPAVAREIAPTLPNQPAWIVNRPLSHPIRPANAGASLDPGETEAMSLAVELHATGVVLDGLQARRVGRTLGLRIVGTLGILLLAKRRGLLASIQPELDALVAVKFHFTEELARCVLADAGEDAESNPLTDRLPSGEIAS